jgi:hypothetical protein
MRDLDGGAPILADGHVHFHACFALARFLDAALENLRAGRRQLGLGNGPGALLFTETSRDHVFRALRDGRSPHSGPWSFEATDESGAIVAVREPGEALLVIAGRQVATGDGLEVLALGTDAEFPDGLPLGEALARVDAAGAIPVLPWGFGKWWLRRGRLVRDALLATAGPRFFLGDNAGRLRLMRDPPLFRAAAARGTLILPGSDPLPFRSQTTKAGRYGFALPGALDRGRPAEALKRILREQRAQPAVFGRRERLLDFCRLQLAMQLRKRGPERPA